MNEKENEMIPESEINKEEVVSVLLTCEKEKELIAAIHAGSESALVEMIQANERLVYHTARDFVKQNPSMPIDDFVSAGKLGLVRAIHRFDIKQNNKFSTYAMSWIKQGMYEFINNSHVVTIPAHIIHQMLQYNRMSNEIGEDEADERIVSELSISNKALSKIKMAKVSKTSLDEPVDTSEGSISYGEIIEDKKALSPFDIIQGEEQVSVMMRAVSELDEMRKDIVMSQCYNEGEDKVNLAELGEKYGVTAERIRQIKEETLLILRERMEELA